MARLAKKNIFHCLEMKFHKRIGIHPKHIIRESSGAWVKLSHPFLKKSRIYKYPPGKLTKKNPWETIRKLIQPPTQNEPINEPPTSCALALKRFDKWKLVALADLSSHGNYHPKTIIMLNPI